MMANFSMAVPSAAPAAAVPYDDPFGSMFGDSNQSAQQTPQQPAPAAAKPVPASVPAPAPQPAVNSFDSIFTASDPAASSAIPSDDLFAAAFGNVAPAATTVQPAPSKPPAPTVPAPRKLFNTAFGGQSLFAGSPTASSSPSGPPAKPAPPAPGNNTAPAPAPAPASSWDPFSGGGGGGGSGGGGGGNTMLNIGPDRGQVNCLDVAEGKRKESMMWARLQKLSRIAPAAALDVLDHADDAAGREAQAMSKISAENLKSGTGKEPDGGAARLTAAIRQAEEGFREALLKCRSALPPLSPGSVSAFGCQCVCCTLSAFA
jgi:hypothetical protein